MLKVGNIIKDRLRASCAAFALSCAAQVALAQPVTGGFTLAITNREAVRIFYNAVYGHRAGVRADWTGNMEQCEAGTTSPAYQDAVLTRVNFYRAIAGVPANVTFRPDYSLKAQAAALIMSANDEITHFPVPGWICYSDLGAEGAASSDLAIASAGMDAIDAYVTDAGPNYRAGHRRWLIFPKTREMGTGDIDPPDDSETQKANALWIFDDHFLDPRPATREEYVAWPPPGYVPHTLVYPRWSFQINFADFTNSVVTMTSNGVPVQVKMEKVEFGYGENALVWVPHGIPPQTRMYWPKPAEDVVYGVNITNIVLWGGTVTNISYQVTVMDPERPEAPWDQAGLAGSEAPAAERLNRYTLTESPSASGYDLRYSELTAYDKVEGAEDESPAVTPMTSGLYSLIQTQIVANGNQAFHLAHSKPPREQWIQLNPIFVPSSESELRFKSRLGGANPEQVARVELSLDEGSSWRELYAQAGDGGTGEDRFFERTLPLGDFAGRAIWLRFNYGFIYGPVSFVRGAGFGVGWYLDDIEVTGAQQLTPIGMETSITPEFDFIPPAPGNYYLDARPRVYGDYTGEWCRGTSVSAVEPDPPMIRTMRIEPAAEGEITVEFDASSLPPEVQVRIEYSETLDGHWEPETEADVTEMKETGAFKARIKKREGDTGFYRIVAE